MRKASSVQRFIARSSKENQTDCRQNQLPASPHIYIRRGTTIRYPSSIEDSMQPEDLSERRRFFDSAE